jgi:tetratricopeptide (TPR) repeat protein
VPQPDPPEAEPIFARVRDRAVELGLPQFEIIGRGGLYTLHAMHGDQRRALELAGDLRAMAERFPIPLFTLISHTALACAHYNLGNLVLARDQFERARAMWQPELPRLQLDQKVLCLGIGTLVLQQLGDTTAAEAWSAEAVAYASALSDLLNVAHAWSLVAQYRMWADDRAGAIAWADRAIAVAAEHGFPVHQGEAEMVKGWGLGEFALQREGFARRAATGHHVGAPMFRLALARTCLDQGLVSEALEELAHGFEFIEASGEARHLAELLRLRAACALRDGRPEAAETDLRRAVAVAREQQSRPFERRAAADLAGLLARRTRRGRPTRPAKR